MATAADDGIEILSCHIEPGEEEEEEEEAEEVCTETTSTNTAASARYSNGKSVGLLTERGDGANVDPVSKHRKRVARVVAIVTFVLLLFSVILIGVSLNMSKNIDDMAVSRSSHKPPSKPPPPKVKVANSSDLDNHLDHDLEDDLNLRL